jgi:hypothetical protein
MAFTPSQKKKVEEIKAIATLVGVDFWNMENERDNDVRRSLLELCQDRLVRTGIVSAYVLIDELLSDIMCQRFFDPKKSSIELWKTTKFRDFNYYVLEELSLLKKLALVKSFKNVPKSVAETIRQTNVVRNAVAHSFFPMNKRDFKKTKRVTYKGKNVFTVEGLSVFDEDTNKAVGFLSEIAFGKSGTRVY